jgi:hypothetical protein
MLALLASAPAAQAKEIAAVTICGASDCRRVTQKHLSNDKLHLLAEAVGEAEPPAAAAPWYRVKIRVRGDGETFGFTVAYVPSEGLLHGLSDAEPVWSTVLPDAVPVFAKLTAGLRPLPASRLTGLDEQPPTAQVDEVLAPAPAGGGASPWPWIAGAAVAALMAAAIRRVRGAQPSV